MVHGLTLARQTNYISVTTNRRTKITAETRGYKAEFWVPGSAILKVSRWTDDSFVDELLWVIQRRGRRGEGGGPIYLMLPSQYHVIRITSDADLHIVNDDW